MPSKALIFLADGTEEMEAVIVADVLRRGGVSVVLAGLAGAGAVKCSRDVCLVPDTSLEEAVKSSYDIIICPGGAKGAENMRESKVVGQALQDQEKKGGFLAAVCAGPTAFLAHGIAKGKRITSHPGVEGQLKGDYAYTPERVVVDGKVITSRGPGTCFEFALAIVEQLEGKEKADSLVEPMLVKM